MKENRVKSASRFRNLMKNLNADKYLILMFSPVFLYYLVFRYIPMLGLYYAFTDFKPGRLFSSQWVGLKWFIEFFQSFFFERVVRNTVVLSTFSLIFSFPIPIIFALLLNEVHTRHIAFKRIVQTVSYLPHFISVVVVVSLLYNFFSPNYGLVNAILAQMGYNKINFFAQSEWFRPLYIGSGVWQSFGWQSIIYIGAISGIDPQLYEAAAIDGAGRWRQLRHITLPGISTTIVILLILSMGGLMSVGFEKVLLLYTPATYETSDVISTYVYRRGIVEARYAFGIAVDLFNSVINFALVFAANIISRKVSSISLW